MKKTMIIITGLCLVMASFSQQPGRRGQDDEIRTIFGPKRGSYGGYGGFGAAYSLIDGKAGFVASGRAAFIFDRSLAIGFAGAGFINDFHYNSVIDKDVNLTGGYGGILVEPIIFGKAPVHITIPIIAGVGGIAYTSNLFKQVGYNQWDSYVEDTEVFLIAEPGVELEFNVLKFFRFSLSATYRFTSSLQLMDTPGDVLRGFSTGVNLKFGKF